MRLERLAYVDDDPDICEIVRFALAEVGGFDVRCWADGATFLAAPRDRWSPQMVLLDMSMPGLSGREVIAALRRDAALAAVPVVVLSGRPDAAQAVSAADGVVGCIAKPFDPLQLAEAVRAAWARQT